MPGVMIGIFGASNESVYYTEFAVSAFRIQGSKMRKRNCSLPLRLTKKEMEDLRTKAERAGVNIQTYFLWMLYNHPIKEAPPIEYKEVLKNLRQINNNLNQIAVKANSMNFIDTSAYWKNVEDLQRTVGKMMEEMYCF